MPIYNVQGEDKLVWWRSRNGTYSVRSAYFGVMGNFIDSHNLRVPGKWMHIWNLKIPQKVKILLWRVARGCLPTRGNLGRRHVPCEEQCPLYHDAMDDEQHAFFTCPQVQQVWKESGIINEVSTLLNNAWTFNDVLFGLLEKLSHDSRNTLAMVFWVLRKRRNENYGKESQGQQLFPCNWRWIICISGK